MQEIRKNLVKELKVEQCIRSRGAVSGGGAPEPLPTLLLPHVSPRARVTLPATDGVVAVVRVGAVVFTGRALGREVALILLVSPRQNTPCSSLSDSLTACLPLDGLLSMCHSYLINIIAHIKALIVLKTLGTFALLWTSSGRRVFCREILRGKFVAIIVD